MQQAAAAQQLRSPVQVKQGSGGSMWPAMVLSFLTAIFAWFWYRGSGKAETEPNAVRGSVETKPVDPETEPSAVRGSAETKPNVVRRSVKPKPSAVRGSAQTKPVHPETGPSTVRGSAETKPSTVRGSAKTKPVHPEGEREGGLTAGSAALRREVTKEGLQADPQKPPKDVPTREEEAQDHLPAQAGTLVDILPQTLTGAPIVDDHQSQPPEVEDNHQPDPHEVKVTPNGIPEAKGILHEEEECPPLMNTVEDEVVRPLLMTGEHGVPILPQDSHKAAQREELYPDGRSSRTEVNGDATGCQLEDSLVIKEKAMGLLKNLNQDLYLEMANTLDEAGGDALAGQILKPEHVEKCETIGDLTASLHREPICLQDDAASMSEDQRLSTGPESSPVDPVNQEKETAGLGNPSTDDKAALDKSSETNIQDLDNQKTRKIATIQPMPQNVNIAFKVHYITQSDSQIIAVTGDHEKLGKWEAYVPLTSGGGGFWSHLITLPADTNLSWKLVMVENGKIKRWEECTNRLLKTTHEDIDVQLCWGFP